MNTEQEENLLDALTEMNLVREENTQLRAALDVAEGALNRAMPWIGENRTGPEWATLDAKIRNGQACEHTEQAVMQALARIAEAKGKS